jgi:cell division protein FtsZ
MTQKKATSTTKPTVKVIGVGCGGNNIVNHISQSNLDSMSFVACDMDAKVLEKSAATTTLQLGTDGLGSGNKPEKANLEAEESRDAIKELFDDKPSLTFVVTCLGGGCGTGAAPIIARESKKMGITTIALATLPFELEGKRRFSQAMEGIRNMARDTDALFLLNNQYIKKQYSDLPINQAFEKADDLLTEVAKSLIHSMTEPKQTTKKASRIKEFFKRLKVR